MKNMALKSKLLFFFLVVGILPFGIIGLTSLHKASSALSRQSYNQLESIRNIKKSQIESYFRERIGDVRVLANNPFVQQAMKDFDSASKDTKRRGGKLTGLSNEKFEAPGAYRKVHDKYFSVFKYYVEQYNYYDLFLMGPDYGDTIFTVTKESDFGQRASEIDSSLRDVWRIAVKNGQIALSDTRPYSPSDGAPAQFVAAPIRDRGEIIGVVALQVSLEAVNTIMGDRSGLGTSGESYLVGQDYLMRSDSLFDPESHSVAASMKNPAMGKVETYAANEALAGKAGQQVIDNYLGTEVLSSYAHLNIEGVTWALITELDRATAFAAVAMMQWITGVTAVFGFLGIFIIAFWVTNSVTKPVARVIENLQSSAAELEATSEQQSTAVTEQTTALAEISTTTQEVVATAKQNAQNTAKVSQGTQQVVQDGQQGKSAVANAQQGMEKTKNQV